MNNEKFKLSIHNSKLIIGSLLGLGVLLRLGQYFYNRSLWLDEAKLALNIIERPFSYFLSYPEGIHFRRPPI